MPPTEYQDPSKDADQVDVEGWSANVGRERHWYKPWTWRNSQYIVEKHSFNRFRDEEVPTLAKRRDDKQALTGPPRQVQKDGKCWTEGAFAVSHLITRHYIKERWIEWWQVNKTLEAYYNFVTGAGPGIPAGAAGVAAAGAGGKTIAGYIAGGASEGALAGTGEAAATGVTGLVTSPAVVGTATFVAAFVTTTYIMQSYVESSEKISEGWEFLSKYDGAEELESRETVWERISPIVDCPKAIEEHWTTPQPPAQPPEEHWTTPQPQPVTPPAFDWFRGWWWLWILIGLAATLAVALLIGGARPSTGATPAQPQAGAPAEPPAAAPASPAPVAPVLPAVSMLRSTLNVPVTTYAVTATDPGGGALTYEWKMAGEACGTPVVPWTQTGPAVPWSHSDQAPDLCRHLTTDHAVVTTVTITTARGTAVTCTIEGSETQALANPKCQ